MGGSYLSSYNDTAMGLWAEVTIEATVMALRGTYGRSYLSSTMTLQWVYGWKLP